MADWSPTKIVEWDPGDDKEVVKFKKRGPTIEEQMEMAALGETVGENAERTPQQKLAMLALMTRRVVGWSGVNDPETGEPVPFTRENLDGFLGSNMRAVNALATADAGEEPDRKNASSGGSDTSSSTARDTAAESPSERAESNTDATT